jgi:molecular chaperone GrpE
MSDEELKPEAISDDADVLEFPAEAVAQDLAALGVLQAELTEAKQQALYAQAETQNVRRRLEKDAQDARAYGATNFARDILSVADNLSRALDAMPEAMRAEEANKGLVTGLEATQRHNRAGNAGWLYDQRPPAAPGNGGGGKEGGLASIPCRDDAV